MPWGKDKDFTFPSFKWLILFNKIKTFISKDPLCSQQRETGSSRAFLTRSLTQISCATLQRRLVRETRKCFRYPRQCMRGELALVVPIFQCWRLAARSGALLTGCHAQMQREVPVFTRCRALSPPELLQKKWWVRTILCAQYLTCRPPVQPPILRNISPPFLFPYRFSVLPGFCFSRILQMMYLTFWGKVFLLMLRPGKLYDIKFWLILFSTYGCQLWVITSVFRKHGLCLCTWRVVTGTCASTAGPLTCHMLSPQLSHRLTTRSPLVVSMRLGLVRHFKLWVHLHPYLGLSFRVHSFGSAQNWTSERTPTDFKDNMCIDWFTLDNPLGGHWPPASLCWTVSVRKSCNSLSSFALHC